MPFQPYNPGDSLETNAVSRIMNPILRAAQTERDAEEQRARMFLAQRQQEQSERAAAANEHRVAIEDARAAQSDRVARANALVEAQKLAQTNPHAAAEYLRAWGHQVDLAPIYEDGPEQAPGTAPAPRPAPQGGSPVPDGAEFGQAPQSAPQGPPGMPGMGPMDGGAMGPHQGRQSQANSPPIAGLPTFDGKLSPADIEAGRQTAMAIPSEAQPTPAQRKILGYRLSAGGQTLFDPLEARQQAQALREQQAQQAAGMYTSPDMSRMYAQRISQGIAPKDAATQVDELIKAQAALGDKNAQREWETRQKSLDRASHERSAALSASKPEMGVRASSTDVKTKSDFDQELTDTEALAGLIEKNPKAWDEYKAAKVRILNDESERANFPMVGKVGVGISRLVGGATGGKIGSPDPDKLGEYLSPEARQINTAIQRKITAKAKALGGAVTEGDIVQIEKGLGIYGSDAPGMATSLRRDLAVTQQRRQDLLNNVRFADEQMPPGNKLLEAAAAERERQAARAKAFRGGTP